jgi:TetR/AcrR family transcriptional regulator, cholesterol catabolism regulator
MPKPFHSPRGDDPGRRGGRIVSYYNPKPGVELKKRAIRQAAAVLLAQRGYHGCGLERIAEAAHLNRGALAYYYASRTDLLNDVLSEHALAISQHVFSVFDAGMAADHAPAERLNALVQALLDAVLAERFEHRAMLTNIDHLPDDQRHAVKLRYKLLLDSFGEVLAAAIPGLSARIGAMTALLMTLASIVGGAATWFNEAGAEDRASYARMVTAMLLAAGQRTVATTQPTDAPTPPPEPTPRPQPTPNPATATMALAARTRHGGATPGTTLWLPSARLRSDIGKLLPEVARGIEIVVTVNGWPVARLIDAHAEGEALQRLAMRGTAGAVGRQWQKERP